MNDLLDYWLTTGKCRISPTFDIHIQNECAHVGLSVHAPVGSCPAIEKLARDSVTHNSREGVSTPMYSYG